MHIFTSHNHYDFFMFSLQSTQNQSHQKLKKTYQKTSLFENIAKTNEILTFSFARSVPRAPLGLPGASWGPFRDSLGPPGDPPRASPRPPRDAQGPPGTPQRPPRDLPSAPQGWHVVHNVLYRI